MTPHNIAIRSYCSTLPLPSNWHLPFPCKVSDTDGGRKASAKTRFCDVDTVLTLKPAIGEVKVLPRSLLMLQALLNGKGSCKGLKSES